MSCAYGCYRRRSLLAVLNKLDRSIRLDIVSGHTHQRLHLRGMAQGTDNSVTCSIRVPGGMGKSAQSRCISVDLDMQTSVDRRTSAAATNSSSTIVRPIRFPERDAACCNPDPADRSASSHGYDEASAPPREPHDRPHHRRASRSTAAKWRAAAAVKMPWATSRSPMRA